MEKSKNNTFLKNILRLNLLSLSTALAVYAYFGIFSRYLADDYCHSGILKNYGFWGAVQKHYLTFSNRYMILVVPYLTDFFGVRGQSYLPGIMIILWLGALYWLLNEIRHLLPITWTRLTSFFLATFLAFFVILQAPNRYQSIYWQASSINRFVPLVLTTYFFAFLLSIIRTRTRKENTLFWSILFFLLTFLIGGFDEMNDVLIFASTLLAFLSIFSNKKKKNTFSLSIISSISLSSLVSVGIMSLSPGIKWRVKDIPTLGVFIQRILTYPKDFIVDTLRTLPLPSFLSLFIPLILFFLLFIGKREEITKDFRKKTLTATLSAPLILYFLLIVNFSPSAYAQAYPADRALLGAQALMTFLLTFEGILGGITLAVTFPILYQVKFSHYLLGIILALFSLYPLRVAWQTFHSIDFYRQRAIAWDARDAEIRTAQKSGKMNLTVPEFDSLHGIKELDDDPNHWVNRCAARYYGVDSIKTNSNYDN